MGENNVKVCMCMPFSRLQTLKEAALHQKNLFKISKFLSVESKLQFSFVSFSSFRFSLIPFIKVSSYPDISLENMSRPGDWNCRSCQHMNFQRRDSCQRCGDPKSGGGDFGSFGGRGGSSFGFTGSDVRPGDWYCNAGNCGAHNFASRSNCFKCGAFKDESAGGYDSDMSRSRGFGFGGGSGRSGWKSGDWICSRSGCNEHNFASRMECFRCNAPRDLSNKTSY
ncbi:hypothetical protein VitviT2T_013582 [Vitis vinifera]|uniref:RanBP2-type domain-containing protein n=1 Tax=Vitis vinifera TaxID=29760 RepID=A0ABY9CJX4_VITVI|nr:hypothetical protein VitviT2T_013582 [Vitis vinifera]